MLDLELCGRPGLQQGWRCEVRPSHGPDLVGTGAWCIKALLQSACLPPDAQVHYRPVTLTSTPA